MKKFNKQKLYESIMNKVSKQIKYALNEAYNDDPNLDDLKYNPEELNNIVLAYLNNDNGARNIIQALCNLTNDSDIKNFIGIYDASLLNDQMDDLLIDSLKLDREKVDTSGEDGETWWVITTFKLFIFKLCCDFGYNINLNWIDVSSVDDMNFLFGYLTDGNFEAIEDFKIQTRFNPNISYWNTKNCTEMIGMFFNNKAFNGDISNWNVKRVTSFAWMFNGCSKVNFNLSKWNISEKILHQQSYDLDYGIGGWYSMEGMLGKCKMPIPRTWMLNEEAEEIITSDEWPIAYPY